MEVDGETTPKHVHAIILHASIHWIVVKLLQIAQGRYEGGVLRETWSHLRQNDSWCGSFIAYIHITLSFLNGWFPI